MNTFNATGIVTASADCQLIAATERLLRSGRKPESLTTREIGAEAGLSPGLVNYYFGSKSALIAKALDLIFAGFMPRWDGIASAAKSARDEAERRGGNGAAAALDAGREALKSVLKDLAAFSVEFAEKGNDFGVRRQLFEGEFDNTRFLAPILRQFLPNRADERALRWAAYFIVVPLQLVFVRGDFLTDWTGTDLSDRAQRDAIIDSTVDRVLEPFAAMAGTDSGHIP